MMSEDVGWHLHVRKGLTFRWRQHELDIETRSRRVATTPLKKALGMGGMFKVERNPAWLSISFLWGLLMSTCSGTLYLYSAYANTFKTHLGFNQTQVGTSSSSLSLSTHTHIHKHTHTLILTLFPNTLLSHPTSNHPLFLIHSPASIHPSHPTSHKTDT